MIKKLLLIFLMCFMFIINPKAQDNEVNLHLFYSKTCTHCHEQMLWLDGIKDNYPNLIITTYEVSTDSKNDILCKQVRKKFGLKNNLIPLTIIGEKYFVGFNEDNKEKMISYIEKYSKEEHRNIVFELQQGIDDGKIITTGNTDDTFTLPIIGKVDAKTVSLPFIAMLIGAIDGFNPCAMWILIFLIGMLMGMENKKRKWALGLTFLITSSFVYLLFMVAWLNVAIGLIQVSYIRIAVAIISLIGAYVNLKGFYKSIKTKDSGCEVVDNKKRKKLMTKIKKFTSEKSFILAMLGVMALAFSVNLIELACSAGLPLIFTQILAFNDLSTFEYAIYIFIYILFFLLDDVIVFVVAMFTMEVTGLSTKYAKYSHLIGGIIMLIVGILMIFRPEWLTFNF